MSSGDQQLQMVSPPVELPSWQPQVQPFSELDAAFFHLYGITRDDAAYILDTFPIVKRRAEAQWGTYRTKDTILEIYAAPRRRYAIRPTLPNPPQPTPC